MGRGSAQYPVVKSDGFVFLKKNIYFYLTKIKLNVISEENLFFTNFHSV